MRADARNDADDPKLTSSEGEARDLSELVRGGYRLTEIKPVDQFRYAAHVEIVARLEK